MIPSRLFMGISLTGLPIISRLSCSYLYFIFFQADRAKHPAGGDGARADGDAGGEDGDGEGGRRRGAGLRRRRLAHPQILVSYLN